MVGDDDACGGRTWTGDLQDVWVAWGKGLGNHTCSEAPRGPTEGRGSQGEVCVEYCFTVAVASE